MHLTRLQKISVQHKNAIFSLGRITFFCPRPFFDARPLLSFYPLRNFPCERNRESEKKKLSFSTTQRRVFPSYFFSFFPREKERCPFYARHIQLVRASSPKTERRNFRYLLFVLSPFYRRSLCICVPKIVGLKRRSPKVFEGSGCGY